MGHDHSRSLGRRPGTPFLPGSETLICPWSHSVSCSRLLLCFIKIDWSIATRAIVTVPVKCCVLKFLLSYLILHFLICCVLLLLLLLLLRNASDLRNCTSYFGACMWVWYCRPPIGAHFHPPPQPPPVPQQLGEKDGSPLCGVARLCRGRRPPLGDRTRLVIIIYIIDADL